MKYDYSESRLKETVQEAESWYGWMRILGINTNGSNIKTLKRYAEKYNIDTSHFDARKIQNSTLKSQPRLDSFTDDELFTNNSKHSTKSIKSEYIRRFLNNIPKCECCGIETWNNKPIVLQIHHKDGNNQNHSKDNLQLLCPNCHSQTENFANNIR